MSSLTAQKPVSGLASTVFLPFSAIGARQNVRWKKLYCP